MSVYHRKIVVSSLLLLTVFMMGIVISGKWPQYTLLLYSMALTIYVVCAIIVLQGLSSSKYTSALIFGILGIIIGVLLYYLVV